MAALDFKAMFNDYIADNQKQWAHDRSKTLGGSEAFGCLRKAWYSRNNTPKDAGWEDGWGALERGNIIENNFVVPGMEHAAKKQGFDFLLGGDNQKTFFDKGDGYLSVTPDGLMVAVARDALAKYGVPDIGSDCFNFEIKSIDPRVDLAEEKAIHHGQVQIQMGLVRENTAFKPNYAVILYINASFLDDIEVFVVKFDPKKYQIAKDRAALIFNTTDPSKLMREGRIDGSCQYCPYTEACIGTVAGSMPGKAAKPGNIPDAMRSELEEVLVEKRDARFAEAKASKAHELANEKLKAVLRKHGISNPKDKDAGWSVSYSMAAGRKTLDKAAMEADGINVADYEKQGSPYEVLRVTFKETDGSED